MMLRSGSAPNPLRFASATNYAAQVGTAASATYQNIRCRIPFRIGSTNLSQLVLSFNGWYLGATGAINYPNSYSVVKMAIEKSGQSGSVPVTFASGRTQTINPGDVDIQSDAVLPSAFSLGSFTKGDLYYMRLEISVPLSTDTFPNTGPSYTVYGFPAAVGLKITTGNDVSAVDSFGTMTFSTGYTATNNPYVPIVLGRAVSGDIRSFIEVGDSIVSGQGDTGSNGLVGGFTRARLDTDGVSNPIAGANFGNPGVTAGTWNNGTSAKLTAYLKYAKYCVEEFGTNEWISSPGITGAAAIVKSKVIWDACAAVGTSVIRPKMLPRTVTDAVTPLNAAWSSGGNARAFNALLESTVGFTLITRNGLRAGATEGTDAFYQWNSASNTGDFTHPNAAGYLLDAADIRAALAAFT